MSTSPTPSVSSSAPAKPQSPFEGRPQVKALRHWTAAVAKDINARARNLPRASAFETDQGRQLLPELAAEDIGLRYPGPLPMTPVAVKSSGDTATVTACAWLQGWGLDPKTGKPAHKKRIEPIRVPMQKAHGKWLVGDVQDGQADCEGVHVEGVRF